MRRLALFAAALLAGCAPTPVDVALRFPSLETFLFTDFARLSVFELEPEELGDCPAILDRVGAGSFQGATLDTNWLPICTFRRGGASFPHVPPGPHAFVVAARDNSNTLLLAGCSVAEAYEGAPPVEVHLFPTDAYAEVTEGRMLPWSSEEDKCGP